MRSEIKTVVKSAARPVDKRIIITVMQRVQILDEQTNEVTKTVYNILCDGRCVEIAHSLQEANTHFDRIKKGRR